MTKKGIRILRRAGVFAAFLLVFLVLWGTTAKAAENVRKVYFFTDVTVDASFEGEFVFIFSKVTLADGGANIFAFFSDINGNGDVGQNRRLAAFFSSVLVGENCDILVNWSLVWVTLLVLGVCRFLFCLVVYALKHAFVEQGGAVFLHEKANVVNMGLAGFVLLGAAAVIFAMTVFFLPVSLFFALLLYVVTLVGEAGLALALGCSAAIKFGKQFCGRNCLIIGLFIIEAIQLIPYVNVAVGFAVLPIVAVGIVLATLTNWFFVKKFYYLSCQRE